jgi:hypothetical protein
MRDRVDFNIHCTFIKLKEKICCFVHAFATPGINVIALGVFQRCARK